MGGDMNSVAERILDRPLSVKGSATDTKNLKQYIQNNKLVDTWRHANPTIREYTHTPIHMERTLE